MSRFTIDYSEMATEEESASKKPSKRVVAGQHLGRDTIHEVKRIMSTRAGAAAHSRHVQQRLVRLLFDHEYAGKGREQHRKLLDFASYTYSDLRTAYLERIQTTHPDKFFNRNGGFQKGKWNVVQDNSDSIGSIEKGRYAPPLHEMWDKRVATTYFIELQDAWKAYDQFYKHMRQSVGEKGEGDFTMFGVGCSFSDNPEERELRNEIMDQACKGWFSAGSLNETSSSTNTNDEVKNSHSKPTVRERSTPTLISEEDLFVSLSEPRSTSSMLRKKRSLVDHLRPSNNNKL